MSNLVAHASLQPSSKWICHGPMIQIRVYKYRAQLDLAQIGPRSFFPHQLLPYVFGSFSFNTLGCHETQLGTSTFVERSRNALGILFKNAWDAFRGYFYDKCCTYPGSDSPSKYWIDSLKIQVSFPNQPRKCPKHLDCDHSRSSIQLLLAQTPYQNSHFLHRDFRFDHFFARCPQHCLSLPPLPKPVHPQWHGSYNQQLAILALPKQCFWINHTNNFSDLCTFSTSWRFFRQIRMVATTALFLPLFPSPFSHYPDPSFLPLKVLLEHFSRLWVPWFSRWGHCCFNLS